MITIIEQGTKRITKCGCCGCKFSFEKEDIKSEVHGDKVTITEKQYVVCPQCRELCIVRQTR